MSEQNSFFQACQEDGEHISNRRLLEELARQKGQQVGGNFFIFTNGDLFAMLDDGTESLIVRHNGKIVCSITRMEASVFYNGPWFQEVEKYRAEIEGNLLAIAQEYVNRLVAESFRMPATVLG